MEFNVDRYVKNYWTKIIGLTDSKENDEFADATSENSVRASRFLEVLNLDPIMPELTKILFKYSRRYEVIIKRAVTSK